MQRYRINYHWLIGVFVSGFAIAVISFFVWKWQIERKADTFLKRAEQALADEDPLEAFDSFRKYVSLRSKDEEARIRMGDAAADVLKLQEASREQKGLAFAILDQTVRTTDDPSLRRKLAEIVIGFRPQDAIRHLEVLLNDNPADAELNVLFVRALFRSKNYKKVKEVAFNLIGYDQVRKEFVAEETALTGIPDVYALLATVLMQDERQRKLARDVIDQMTVANPDSAQAHLAKSVFLRNLDEKEEAKEFLDKAYELDPNDASILLRKGSVALTNAAEAKKEAKEATEEGDKEAFAKQSNEYAELAKEHFATGLKEHPDSIVFYRSMAAAEQGLEDDDAALKILDQGIAKFDENQSITLVIYKIDLLLKKENYLAIEKELRRLTLLNQTALVPVIDFQRARVKYSKQLWVETARDLKRVRPLLLDWPNYQVLAGAMLGHCYEKQGARDLALEAYEIVLNDDPNHGFAKNGRARVRKHIRPPKKRSQGPNVDKIIDELLTLPEAEQDWSEVDKLVDAMIEEHQLTESRAKLLRSRVLIKRGQYAEAEKLIREASAEDKEDIDVNYAAVLLVATDPERGPAAALKLLDRMENKWGRTLRSRIRRADMLAVLNSEDVVDQLRALTAPSEDMTKAEQIRMYTVVGLKLEQLNKLEESHGFWLKAAEMQPNSLPIRMHLFDLALRKQDDASMEEAQQAILELVVSKDNPSYILTEVKRLAIKFSRHEIGLTELATGRKRLDTALRERPEWADLHILYGQLLLLLKEDVDLAMQHFDDALKYGSRNINAIALQVKLLAERGLFRKARDRMDRLPENSRGRLLEKLEAEILNQTGDKQAAFVSAKKWAAGQPDNPETQVWFSRLARQVGELDSAVSALRQAMKLNASNPDQWIQLVGLYSEQKDFENVENTIREAHLSVDAEYLPLLTAKYYELQSRWKNAESIYLAYYEGRFEELAIAHRMAEFYLLWAPKDVAYRGKATPPLNRILRAANSGDATWDNPHVVWARQQAARLLAMENNYQQSLKAERLLQQGTSGEARTENDLLQLIDILVSRKDPRSLLKAKQLLTNFRKQGRLQKKGMLQLANILSKANEWDDCKSLMLEAISQHRSDAAVWSTYIDLLIDRGEYTGAKTYIKRLKELDPGNSAHVQYSAKVAAAQGDSTQLRKLLISLLPKLDGALSQVQLRQVLNTAGLATRHGDYELAEKLLRKYESRVPQDKFHLTKFLAMHGNSEEALDRMKRDFSNQTDRIASLANRMISTRRNEFGGKYDEPVDRLIDAALRDDPDSVSRQLIRAEAYEAQEKSKESIAVYDQILRRDDLPLTLRAAAMNNLGFQLALLNLRLDEAEQLINKAMQTFGPVSDMLDTRAIVYISQKKYDLAIKDMKLAISVDQDPIKHFHLAKAYILAGDGKAAQKAWKKARELDFDKESLPNLEKPGFDAIVQQIENF